MQLAIFSICTKILTDKIDNEEEMNWPSAGDGKLRDIMQEIMTVTPGIGQTLMLGALHSRGIRVQRWKVREMMREQDPAGTALRWRN